MFPNYWAVDIANLSLTWLPTTDALAPIGVGFTAAEDALPSNAVKVFVKLSIVDRILNQRGLHWAS